MMVCYIIDFAINFDFLLIFFSLQNLKTDTFDAMSASRKLRIRCSIPPSVDNKLMMMDTLNTYIEGNFAIYLRVYNCNSNYYFFSLRVGQKTNYPIAW
jgi:hypothetical protein